MCFLSWNPIESTPDNDNPKKCACIGIPIAIGIPQKKVTKADRAVGLIA